MKTRIKLFLGICICLIYSNCNNSSTTTNPSEKAEVIEQVEEIPTGKVITATYQSAAVYAGKTEYAFTNQAGETFLITTDNLTEEPTVAMPENMLEDDEDLEGPPGENPELVGKQFKIYYGPDDQVTKIELAK